MCKTPISRRAILTHLPTAALAATAIGKVSVANADAVTAMVRLMEIEARLSDVCALIHDQNRAYGQAVRLSQKLAGTCPNRHSWFDTRDEWYWNHSYTRYQKRRALAVEASGEAAIQARLEELREQREELGGLVWDIRATTLAAVKVKARISRLSQSAIGSVIDDILDLEPSADV